MKRYIESLRRRPFLLLSRIVHHHGTLTSRPQTHRTAIWRWRNSLPKQIRHHVRTEFQVIAVSFRLLNLKRNLVSPSGIVRRGRVVLAG
jgi:hypothetical protein